MFEKLDATILYVKDIIKAKNFYTNILGLTINYDDGEYVSLKVEKTDRAKIDLNSYKDPSNHPGHQTIILKTDNIAKTYTKLKNSVNILEPLKKASWGKTFIFADPDGNKIEVVE